jgi:hypothetical protein
MLYMVSGLEPEPELEQKFGFAVPWSRRRKKYFRLRNSGFIAKNETTHIRIIIINFRRC